MGLLDHIKQPCVDEPHQGGRINLHLTYVDAETEVPAVREHSHLKEGFLIVVSEHNVASLVAIAEVQGLLGSADVRDGDLGALAHNSIDQLLICESRQ